jgi:hypothetical protein
MFLPTCHGECGNVSGPAARLTVGPRRVPKRGMSNRKDGRPLAPAAERALAEAAQRRAEIDRKLRDAPEELNGRKGPDPVRYGDWEVKGLASDF